MSEGNVNKEGGLPKALADEIFKDTGDIDGITRELRREAGGAEDALSLFLDMVESLKDVVPDEAKCYKAALAALKNTRGMSKEEVLEASNSRLDSIEKYKGMIADAAVERGTDTEGLEARARELKTRIKDLEDELSKLKSEEKSLKVEVLTSGKAAKRAEERFRSAFGVVRDEVRDATRKIERYTSSTPIEQEPEPKPEPEPEPVTDPRPEPVKAVTPEPLFKSSFGSAPEKPGAPPGPLKIKKCPSCKQGMEWLQEEHSWRCPYCNYQRIEF